MPAKRRFQSHFFQTLQSQLYRVQGDLQLRWRQFKTAAVWNAQITLYPLHVAFRAGRWSRQVLKHQAEKGMGWVSRASGLKLGLKSGPKSGLKSTEKGSEVDRPIQNVLTVLNVQKLPPIAPTPSFQQPVVPSALEQRRHLWPIPDRSTSPQKLSLIEKCGRLWQKLRGTASQNQTFVPLDSDVTQSPLVAIHGIASSLEDRRLVLIAADNQVLDILTREQQQQLHRRISFELTTAPKRRWRFRVWMSRFVPSLPFARLFTRFRAGGLQLSHAVPAGVLPESTPVQMQIPELSAASVDRWTQQIVSRLRAWRGTILTGISAIAVAPFAGALPTRTTTAPAPPSQPLPSPWGTEWIAPTRNRKQWLRGFDLFGQSKPIQGKIRLSPEHALEHAPEKTSARSPSGQFQTAIADWAYRYTQAVPSTGSPPIDVNAAFMGYHYHPLEKLLLILDRAMAWLETQISWLWQLSISGILAVWKIFRDFLVPENRQK
jgi:hypothetical protein